MLMRTNASRPQHWDSIDDLLVPLDRNLHGHTIGWTPMGRKNEDFCSKNDWRKSPGGIATCNYYSFQCVLTTLKKKSGTTNNMPRMWAHLQMKVGFWRIQDQCLIKFFFFVDVLNKQHK